MKKYRNMTKRTLLLCGLLLTTASGRATGHGGETTDGISASAPISILTATPVPPSPDAPTETMTPTTPAATVSAATPTTPTAPADSTATSPMTSATDLQTEGPGDNRVWLTAFTAVEVSAALDLRLVCLPAAEIPRIVYNTHGSTTTRFRAEVYDGVLTITERRDARRVERTTVTLYYNTLTRLEVTDASVTLDTPLSATLFDLAADGAARITAPLEVGDLHLELKGKSHTTLTGRARYLTAYVSGAELDASGLETMSSQANVTGSGRASLWATDRLEGKTSAGGSITYKGTPTIVRGAMKFMGGEIVRLEE